MMAEKRKKEDTCDNAGGISLSACAEENCRTKKKQAQKNSKWRLFDQAKKSWEESGIDV